MIPMNMRDGPGMYTRSISVHHLHNHRRPSCTHPVYECGLSSLSPTVMGNVSHDASGLDHVQRGCGTPSPLPTHRIVPLSTCPQHYGTDSIDTGNDTAAATYRSCPGTGHQSPVPVSSVQVSARDISNACGDDVMKGICLAVQ